MFYARQPWKTEFQHQKRIYKKITKKIFLDYVINNVFDENLILNHNSNSTPDSAIVGIIDMVTVLKERNTYLPRLTQGNIVVSRNRINDFAFNSSVNSIIIILLKNNF